MKNIKPLITSPHMGNTYIAVKAFLETVGCLYVPCPPTSRRTIELGARYSPEFACFPFKVTLGNMIEALEKGANVILMAAGRKGLCRLAYYHIVQEKILKNLGFEFEMVGLGNNLRDVLFRKIELWSGKRSTLPGLIKATAITFRKLKLIRKIENLTRNLRPYQVERGGVEKISRKALALTEEAKTFSQLKTVEREIKRLFTSIPIMKKREVLKVVVVGEFFCCLEPAVSFQIEKILGEMGVLVTNNMSSYRLAKGFLFPDLQKWWINRFIVKKYLRYSGGGEERRTLGEIEIYARKGYDGVCILSPFLCLPENTAKTILPSLSKKFKIPVLSFSLDENFSEVNMLTRVESFVDMLRRKKNVSGN